MSDVAIRVEGLSKAYRIGVAEQRHETLMGAVTSFIKSPLRNFRDLRNLSRFDDAPTEPVAQSSVVSGHSPVVHSEHPPSDIFWALKDISFEVKRGEALGIIGRNGAGKSTLLKILSRITEPTRGRAQIHGRVGSLLEVGTGFHPDLTGRENIYLNGTILGMKKREVDARFDDIVDFSGVEKFIDTPVKRYSSGMRVRLAFAVAAHLEPEILIVDEVLAVGDAEFQRKCLGKMEDVAKRGRTVLFVSHNMAAIQSLTVRSILLNSGKIAMQGLSSRVVEDYLSSGGTEIDHDTRAIRRSQTHYGIDVKICSISPAPKHGSSFLFGEELAFGVKIEARISILDARLGVTIEDASGSGIMTCFTPENVVTKEGYESNLLLRLTDTRLSPGFYRIAISVGKGGVEKGRREFDVVRPGPSFEVEAVGANGINITHWPKSYGHIVHSDLEAAMQEYRALKT